MQYHLAIVDPATLQNILSGAKTIESRLTKVACAPYGRILPGDCLYLKIAGGSVCATATVHAVYFEAALTPERIRTIANSHAPELCWSAGWLEHHLDARYCTLIWLADVCPFGPLSYKQRGRSGWIVLDAPIGGRT